MKSSLNKEINSQYSKLINCIIPEICLNKNNDVEKYRKSYFMKYIFCGIFQIVGNYHIG